MITSTEWMLLDMHPCLVHSLVIGKVAVFSVVDIIVALLEVVDIKVAVFPKVTVVIGRPHWLVCLLGQPVVRL